MSAPVFPKVEQNSPHDSKVDFAPEQGKSRPESIQEQQFEQSQVELVEFV